MRIGVDLMGSESSPLYLFPAVLQAAAQFPQVQFIALVTEQALEEIRSHPPFAQSIGEIQGCLEFHVAEEAVEMEDDPLMVVRTKKKSSLVVGLVFLKDKFLDALITAGNTGALIAGAALFLPLLEGIKRPALLANLPTKNGKVSIVDVGGNVSCPAHQLVKLAKMGAAYFRSQFGVERPRIALLNIGVESKKGTPDVREAFELLQEEEGMLFVGNIEGREVFGGGADVVVTDGFTGNVLLKTAEGVYTFILDQLKSILGHLDFDQKQTVYTALQKQFDYEEYMGAIVCGIEGVAVKCHGNSTPKSLYNGIVGAINLAKGAKGP